MSIDAFQARRFFGKNRTAKTPNIDSLLESMTKQHKSITKNSSKFSMKLRMLNFLIGNRLYFYKFKKIFGTK